MIEFKLPALGADMDKGTLLEWRVKPGDKVAKGDIVAIVDTSKAAVDIESWHEGSVHALLVEPGATVAVGTTLAILREAGESADQLAAAVARMPIAAATTAQAPAAVSIAMPLQPPPDKAVHAEKRVSPAARRRAQELGIDLDTVQGSGPGGAVGLSDVDAARAAKAAPVDKAKQMRRAIGVAMARSKREIPHYYLCEQVNLAAASDWLRRENARRAPPERLLMAALYLKAVALAAKRHPALNGFFIDEEFRPSEAVHVGVAISLRSGGLIAPAVRDVDRLPLNEVMRALSDLVMRTRAGSLRSSELADPTLTVTNLGEQSVDAVYGVIHPPQVALVGVGKISERALVVGGVVCAQPAADVTLSADHRASDGHDGALFLATIRDLLQHPEAL